MAYMMHDIEFREEMEDVFRRMPVMESWQFVRLLGLVSGYDGWQLDKLVHEYVINGIVLLSENGLVTTKFSVGVVGETVPDVRMTGGIRTEAFRPKQFFSLCMDCFPIILDMYPDSCGFRTHDTLFQMSFVHERKGLEYEVIRIPRNRNDTYRGLILKESMMYRDSHLELVRNNLRRIAVVESAAAAPLVPYAGFSFICTKGSPDEKGFKIVEKRKDDLWRDVLE